MGQTLRIRCTNSVGDEVDRLTTGKIYHAIVIFVRDGMIHMMLEDDTGDTLPLLLYRECGWQSTTWESRFRSVTPNGIATPKETL